MIKCVKSNKYIKFYFKGIIEDVCKLESDSFASIGHASSTKHFQKSHHVLVKKRDFPILK